MLAYSAWGEGDHELTGLRRDVKPTTEFASMRSIDKDKLAQCSERFRSIMALASKTFSSLGQSRVWARGSRGSRRVPVWSQNDP